MAKQTEVERLCAGVPEAYREQAVELTEQLFFQTRKLRESREAMENAPIIMAYDNGGGQRGVRKNPAYEAYNSLMQNYRKTLALMVELVGASHREDEDTPLARILAEAEEVLARADR